MADYPWLHIPGHAAPIHTPASAVPPLDEELAGALEGMAGVHPGVDMICDGIRYLALDQLTADQTQTILTTIAGDADVLTALALLVQRLTNPASNPALRSLTSDVQKQVQHRGELYAYDTEDLTPRQHTSEAAALIDGI